MPLNRGRGRYRAGIIACAVLLAAPLGGCAGVQSALEPAGKDAQVLADLFWVMLVGAVILWVLVNAFFFYITRLQEKTLSRRLAETLIIGGGIVFPTVTIGALLVYGLSIMPDQRAPGEGLTIKVTGHQWWWRVEYWPDSASAPIISANEIRLPVGKRTEIKLAADKVIHSFWIPSLAGKMDMIPGRETRLALEPVKVGTYRGQCAEFCGKSHAQMAFQSVVMEPGDFDAWLARQSGDAAAPDSEAARRGREVFLAQGCGACHSVRGTPAVGRTGPDLTHVGGRVSLAAGVLPATIDAFRNWTRHAAAFKPGVEMPSYDYLSEDQLSDLAHYLEGLK